MLVLLLAAGQAKTSALGHSVPFHSRCAAQPLTSLVSVLHLSGPLGASHSTPKGCFPWQYLLVCLLVEGGVCIWVGFLRSDLSQLRVELGKSFSWKSQEP